jgi:histidine ammonia-lyase
MFKELEKITDVVKRGDILEAVEDKADLKFF